MTTVARAAARPSLRLAACGALCAAVAVALSAYAAHTAAGTVRTQLLLAAAVAFGHGLALAALAPMAGGRLRRTGLWALLLGLLAFAGSLAAHALAGWPALLAPAGGMLLIAGWLVIAVDLLRSRGGR